MGRMVQVGVLDTIRAAMATDLGARQQNEQPLGRLGRYQQWTRILDVSETKVMLMSWWLLFAARLLLHY